MPEGSPSRPSAPPMRCAVCADSSDASSLIYCKGCGVHLHQECYLPSDHSANLDVFQCQVCVTGSLPSMQHCALCGRSGGALIGTVEGHWVHGVCALYMPGVYLAAVSGKLVAEGVQESLRRSSVSARASMASQIHTAGPPDSAQRCLRDPRCVRGVRHSGRCKLVTSKQNFQSGECLLHPWAPAVNKPS